MKDNELHLNVHGLDVRFRTTLSDFRAFIDENYALFGSYRTGEVDVSVQFDPQSGADARDRAKSFRQVGDGIRYGDSAVYWENNFGFNILVERTTDALRVRAFHRELAEDQSAEERYKNFQRSMRWVVHFPVFTLLQYRREWRLVHGAAVTDGDRTFAFCGLNKIGKSTLATYLCREEGYSLITDNYLLVGSERVYAFPEVVRLDPASADRFGLEGIWSHLVYGKEHVSPTAIGTASEAVPDAFFLLSRGGEVSSAEIEPQTAWQSMQNLHAMLGEFPQHGFMSVWPVATGETRPVSSAETILFDTPWYSLSYDPNWEFRAVTEEVHGCI
ncbi:hypothetical protein [Halosimplex salinum]|uniref:hypothetical protein n=1 Tax=Halosimplex salinum TaxID=1710538 RepID=UPI000F470A92|nr:hypothetical protein [Halosimplex salinum]